MLSKKKESLRRKKKTIFFDAVIVRSRQVIKRADGSIDNVSRSARIELISTSMIQNLWFSAWRTTQKKKKTDTFLLGKSASLIRCYPVHITNLDDMKAECQVAIIWNRFFPRTILIKCVEVKKLMESVVGKTMWFTIIEFVKMRNDKLSIWRIFFSKTSDQEKEFTKFLTSCIILL